jgi:hypothetical protein
MKDIVDCQLMGIADCRLMGIADCRLPIANCRFARGAT